MLAHLLLFLSWIAYYALHSWLATDSVKSLMQRSMGQGYRLYRILYNVKSMVLLLAIVYFHWKLESPFFMERMLVTTLLGVVLAALGSFVLTHAFFTVNLREFLGLAQLDGEIESSSQTPKRLIRSGFYAYVRHPFYFGVIMILLGLVLLIPSYATLMMLLATMLYLPVGVALEEKKLIREFGEDYLRYRKEVKAFIPFIV
ncbi:MAG: isoprenylcysteine carboxylmethyltransferase family protein [Cryomorphaceae bacterium]|nr:MAG: isoprenylcysteine carboxylmethyltransferase family protein [Cryomorphaceae bacterium]